MMTKLEMVIGGTCSFGINRLDQPIAFGICFNLEVLCIGSTVTSVLQGFPFLGGKGWMLGEKLTVSVWNQVL